MKACLNHSSTDQTVQDNPIMTVQRLVGFWSADKSQHIMAFTLNVMKISFFPTGILTVWPSSTPKGKNKHDQY